MISTFNVKTPRIIIFFIDFIICVVSLYFAFLIRFDFEHKIAVYELFYYSSFSSFNFLIYLLICVVSLLVFKTHMGLVRYTSIVDIKRVFFSTLFISSIILFLNFLKFHFFDSKYLFPISTIFIQFFVAFTLAILYRFIVKVIFFEYYSKSTVFEKQNVLIYGAGVSGLITKRTLEKDNSSNFNVVGFIDDNLKLCNSRLHGLKIYHSSVLIKLIEKFDLSKVIIAIQTPDFDNQKKVLDICFDYSIDVLQVPSSKKWINGDFSTNQIKNIRIDDLLGRNPIYLNKELVSSELLDQIVLVTGAAGSIGSGIVKELTAYKPKLVILLDQAESPLYDLEQELIQNFPDFKFEIVVGDISHLVRLNRLFEHYTPSYIFHAAAYKHVPLMEDNPSEAINTNVLGTKNLADLSVQYGVVKFVMISTDKAVNPTNVMGASKRIAEIYVQSLKSDTKFITTRFGNVLGSNGSVIPLFKKQIEQGGPITITDRRVTRYFMTIPEACQLVLEACTIGNGGEIFVFDMGESVKIIDLAKKMIKLSGLVEGKDIEIKVTGLRPGEKLYEELLAEEENTLPTHHPKILIAKTRIITKEIVLKISDLITLYDTQNNVKIVQLMKDIVPEFISNNSEFSKLD